MQIYLTVTVGKDTVTPEVGVSTVGFSSHLQGAVPTQPDIETVRHGLEIANQVLGFAEGIRREP